VAVLRTDGGMVENDPLMQFQAEILDRVMVRPALKETTALGAGLRGRPGNRLFQSAGDLQSRWPAGRTWEPNMDGQRRERVYGFWKKAVTRSFGWARFRIKIRIGGHNGQKYFR
jgi:glycerol kinase